MPWLESHNCVRGEKLSSLGKRFRDCCGQLGRPLVLGFPKKAAGAPDKVFRGPHGPEYVDKG